MKGDLQTFSVRFNEILRIRRITKVELAKLVNCSHSTIYTYVIGRNFPTKKNLLKICKILQISPDWLLGLTDTQEPEYDSGVNLEIQRAIKGDDNIKVPDIIELDNENREKTKFSIRLNEALVIRNLKQSDLSRMTGFSRSRISSYSKSINYPSIDAAKKIAAALMIDYDWLIGVSDKPNFLLYSVDTSKSIVMERYNRLSPIDKEKVFNYINDLLELETLKETKNKKEEE